VFWQKNDLNQQVIDFGLWTWDGELIWYVATIVFQDVFCLEIYQNIF